MTGYIEAIECVVAATLWQPRPSAKFVRRIAGRSRLMHCDGNGDGVESHWTGP
jgi:hypothetical protein